MRTLSFTLFATLVSHFLLECAFALPQRPDIAPPEVCREKLIEFYEGYRPSMSEELLEFGRLLDPFLKRPSLLFDQSFWSNEEYARKFDESAEKVPYPKDCHNLMKEYYTVNAKLPCTVGSLDKEWFQELGKLMDKSPAAADVFKAVICCETDDRYFAV